MSVPLSLPNDAGKPVTETHRVCVVIESIEWCSSRAVAPTGRHSHSGDRLAPVTLLADWVPDKPVADWSNGQRRRVPHRAGDGLPTMRIRISAMAIAVLKAYNRGVTWSSPHKSCVNVGGLACHS